MGFFSSEPPPPSGVRVSQIGLDDVLVSWTPPSDVTFLTGYIIYRAHGEVRDSVVIVGNDTSATLSGLSLWVTYNISVASNSESLPSLPTTSHATMLGNRYVTTSEFHHAELIHNICSHFCSHFLMRAHACLFAE